MKEFFCFLCCQKDSFHWLISKLIHWSLSSWIKEIHTQECLGAFMAIEFSMVVGLLLFFNGSLCFGCEQWTLSRVHETSSGVWRSKHHWPLATTRTATLHRSKCHCVIAQPMVGIAECGSSFWTSGFSYFPSPAECPCHVPACLCHSKQLCDCRAGFSQQLWDKELSFEGVKVCPLFSLLQVGIAASSSQVGLCF